MNDDYDEAVDKSIRTDGWVEVECPDCGFTWDIEAIEASLESCIYCPECRYLAPLGGPNYP